ncbi:MAG TPA: 5'-methylthioadenosine/adenosylhomocysteine nucleosidase [Clostridiaceae bacterium]|nr:5'-methylthioadenosine/adenosylhomocysteine nucleosidase [Clostridiaceae bacterium]
MAVGIITAMREELEPMLRHMKLEHTVEKAKMTYHSGLVYGRRVVAVVSGIGKVNAGICAQILIDDFNVKSIVNIGIAGGTGENVMPGDLVVADDLVQHDVDTTAFGDELGQVPRVDTFAFPCDEEMVKRAIKACEEIKEHNCFVGRIVTGDQFINHTDKLKWLSEKFGALACEMEGGSIAQVCYLNDVPFVIIRSISDNGNIGIHMDYETFKPIAIENSTKILVSILLNI